MKPRLVVVSLWAENVSALVHFYRDVVGLSLSEHRHDPPHFDWEGPSLAILKGKQDDSKSTLGLDSRAGWIIC